MKNTMHISHRPQVLCQQGYHLKQRQVSFLSQGDSVHGPHANQWRLSQTPLKLKQSKRFFTYHEKEYPVCYKSNYWELDSPANTDSATVLNKLKSNMAWYSIPKQLVTDYGPQFTSTKFKSFTKTWGIEHTTTSPHHRRANRKVESAVKTAKKCFVRHQNQEKTSTWLY